MQAHGPDGSYVKCKKAHKDNMLCRDMGVWDLIGEDKEVMATKPTELSSSEPGWRAQSQGSPSTWTPKKTR